MEEIVDVIPGDLGHHDEDDKPGRSRVWMLLLYPDTDESGSHKQALEKLDELDWNYCGRVHDSDPGVKSHHHVIVCFQNGRLKADIANDLGIDTRWIRRVHSQKKAMRYLCHKDNSDKFQYSPAEIYGTLADKAIAQCSKGDAISEVEGTSKVIEIINSFPSYTSVSLVLPLVLAEGVYPHYRRLGNSVFRLIQDHNDYIAQLEGKRNENSNEK